MQRIVDAKIVFSTSPCSRDVITIAEGLHSMPSALATLREQYMFDDYRWLQTRYEVSVELPDGRVVTGVPLSIREYVGKCDIGRGAWDTRILSDGSIALDFLLIE